MTAATFHTPTAFPASRKTPKPGLLARFYAALLEGRMRAAMREVARNRHLIPEDVLKKSGYVATLTDDSRLPFTR
jgi:hypothetical protein